MNNNIVWAALVTRIPAADDLPMSTLVDLIETSSNDVEERTGQEITQALTPSERARCRTAVALGHTQPCLKDADGHNASQAWACSRTASAERVYRLHARDVLAEISSNPFAYLRGFAGVSAVQEGAQAGASPVNVRGME
ncbi:hypothetical protein NHF46_11675 [Arthrobacter alpinus]|nr:hypothetical protein [Arthrobacter alpinus]